MREVNHGASFGCLPLEQHFGLGKASQVECLEIRWPSSLVQRVENPPVNQTIKVTEGQPGWSYIYAQGGLKVT